ncbi:MAG TPA: hypothetical protein VIY49_10490 [Bryobacteraceae bacterium]
MKLSPTEFEQLARTHETAEDHVKLAAHFNAHAEEHENDAKLHEQLADHLAGHHGLAEAGLAGESRHYAAHSHEAAEAMRSLAKIHESLAKGHRVRV